MSTDIAVILNQPGTLEQFARALPSHLKADRFARIALTVIRKNKDLQKCSTASIMSALIQSAQLGLEPGTALQHAYLIPYGDECTFIPGWRGLVMLAKRSGEISDITADVVHQGDVFKVVKGLKRDLIHEPTWEGDKGDAAVIAAYAVAHFKDGSTHFEVMSRAEIDRIKNRGRRNPVWNSDYQEMCRKTAVRRLSKYMPLSSEDFAKAVQADDDADKRYESREQTQPNKLAGVVQLEGEEQRKARADADRRVAMVGLEHVWQRAQESGLDPEKVVGMSEVELCGESVNFLDSAREKLLEALANKQTVEGSVE